VVAEGEGGEHRLVIQTRSDRYRLSGVGAEKGSKRRTTNGYNKTGLENVKVDKQNERMAHKSLIPIDISSRIKEKKGRRIHWDQTRWGVARGVI
jgi:hypothetical protein